MEFRPNEVKRRVERLELGYARFYGGRSLLTFASEPDVLASAAQSLAERVRSGRIGSLTITKIDGADALSSAGPVVDALTAAGFTMTPRGLRLRNAAR